MTNRELAFAKIGFHYVEGIEQYSTIVIPTTGRLIMKTVRGTWEAQPWGDNEWIEYNDLLKAATAATPPEFRRTK